MRFSALTSLLVATVAIVISLGATPALAVRLIVQDPCSATPWYDVEAVAEVDDHVGNATIRTLDALDVPYQGAVAGLNSIRDSVTGEQALEIISDRELRSYGWCYRINDLEPADYPHQVAIQNDSDVIFWFFAFAHYLDGQWVSVCTPTHLTRPAFLCQ